MPSNPLLEPGLRRAFEMEYSVDDLYRGQYQIVDDVGEAPTPQQMENLREFFDEVIVKPAERGEMELKPK